jgi:hypothetical protein
MTGDSLQTGLAIDIPQPHEAVVPAAGDDRAIAIPVDGSNPPIAALNGTSALSALDLPNFDRQIRATCDDSNIRPHN